jgi:chemotaxis protein MotB
MSRILASALVLALATGCVLRSTYQEQVSRADRLARESEARAERIRKLEEQQGNLELSRSALDEERVALIAELEQLRERKLQIAEELEQERSLRASQAQELRAIAGTYQSLVEELEQEVKSGQVEIHSLRGRLQVRALEGILFDSGSAEIKPAGQAVLRKVAARVRELPGHHIVIEGHTDSVPISKGCFPSNWELSSTRAARVVRYLVEQGIDAGKLAATGHGPQRPIGDNETAQGRARNRRIEIVLVPEGEG